jgi:hypothetical protein
MAPWACQFLHHPPPRRSVASRRPSLQKGLFRGLSDVEHPDWMLTLSANALPVSAFSGRPPPSCLIISENYNRRQFKPEETSC